MPTPLTGATLASIQREVASLRGDLVRFMERMEPLLLEASRTQERLDRLRADVDASHGKHRAAESRMDAIDRQVADLDGRGKRFGWMLAGAVAVLEGLAWLYRFVRSGGSLG